MFKSREGEDHVCEKCLKSPKKYRISRASGIYAEALLAVIHSFKYKGKIELAKPLSLLLFFTLIKYWNKNNLDLIIPVPLHITKFRSRGFNQAFLLIRNLPDLAEKFHFDFSGIKINKDALLRTRLTKPQTSLGRKERLLNIKNAFSINDSAIIKGQRILIVDDVYTTGATVQECARVLLKNGAEYVDVLTLARTM